MEGKEASEILAQIDMAKFRKEEQCTQVMAISALERENLKKEKDVLCNDGK